jgi:hypothetical protein
VVHNKMAIHHSILHACLCTAMFALLYGVGCIRQEVWMKHILPRLTCACDGQSPTA